MTKLSGSPVSFQECRDREDVSREAIETLRMVLRGDGPFADEPPVIEDPAWFDVDCSPLPADRLWHAEELGDYDDEDDDLDAVMWDGPDRPSSDAYGHLLPDDPATETDMAWWNREAFTGGYHWERVAGDPSADANGQYGFSVREEP